MMYINTKTSSWNFQNLKLNSKHIDVRSVYVISKAVAWQLQHKGILLQRSQIINIAYFVWMQVQYEYGSSAEN